MRRTKQATFRCKHQLTGDRSGYSLLLATASTPERKKESPSSSLRSDHYAWAETSVTQVDLVERSGPICRPYRTSAVAQIRGEFTD